MAKNTETPEKKLDAEQIAFLLELLNTKGIAFPIEKCALAARTNEDLANLATGG